MELYSSNESYKLYQGNMLDMLEVIEPNSIDSIITDPPYGLTSITKRFGKENSAECQYGKDGSFARLSRGFMGKEWDGSGIEYNVDTWQKCYEVLKPGGYLLAFGGSRTFHRIACAIEDAGFEIRDTIMWLYGEGFPKSMNVGKQLEKRLEDEKTKQKTEHDLRLMWERDLQKTKRNEKKQDEVLQSQLQEQSLQGTMYGEKSKESNLWREEPSMERWNNIQKTERELQRCKVCEMSKRVFINGEERWICNGTQISDGEALREMFEQSGSCPSYRPQSEQQQDRKLNAIQEQCRTQESREIIEYWNKFGTALKPSFEPIIVARKPFKGSLIDNVIEYGVGGINIDECRVGDEKRFSPKATLGDSGIYNWNNETNENEEYKGKMVAGRFPANTILTYDETDFEEVCGGFPNTKSVRSNRGGARNDGTTVYNKIPQNIKMNYECGFNDSGSASRYFMNCKYTRKDEEIWKQLLVNNVGNNLEILKATKDNIVQMNVEDLLKELKDHYAKYVGNQLDLIETPIVQDIVEMLTWDFKIETSRVIQDFIGNYKKCIQFLNLVQFVEKMDNIDTTQTTQNLLKLFGYVKVVITNYIQGNIEYDQKRYIYTPKASKKDRDEGLPNKWLDNLELILYNNIGDELWKDKITIKEENKAKHLEDMEASLQKVIEEYGIQTKKDIDLNMLLYGKKSLEKYLKENKYTTKMEINSTTVSQILNLLTLYTTKENIQDAKLETENGTNHVEIVENTNQLEIIIKGNQELVPGANNVVLKMLLKINEKEGRNEHCTVKPTNLMQYLVRLVTPNGGTILDPFNGSGSTGKAVMYENKERNKNYKYIGIELTEEYLPIAKARIEYVCKLAEEEKNEERQLSIYDV